MSRRGRRPADFYEEEEFEEEEIIDERDRRRRDLHERYVDPEPEPESRRRPRPRREPTPPHLKREIDELIRLREKAREEPERLLRRPRGGEDEEERLERRKFREMDDEGERDRFSGREETEEMYLRRGSLPRERPPRRRLSRDDDERLRLRRSREDDNSERERVPGREEIEEMYLRRGSLPPDRPPRRRLSRDDDERIEMRRSREDGNGERDRLPHRETEEIFVRRESLPRDRHPRRRLSRDDDERIERRRSREEEDVVERREIVIEEDDKHRRRRRHRSREVEEREGEEQDDAEIRVRRRHRSPLREEEVISENLRRRSLLPQDEREEEIDEERLFRHRDRSPRRRPVRDDREEVLLRHRDASLRRKEELGGIRRSERNRSMPDYDEEEDDIFIRRRDRSLPAREERRDEITIRHPERPLVDRGESYIRRREHSAPERDDDRDEVSIRRREHLHYSHRGPEDDIREMRVRRRHSVGRDEEEDDEREEILVRRGRRDHKPSLALEEDREEIYIRDEPGRETVQFRHRTDSPVSIKSTRSRHGSLEREEIIRLSEHKEREHRNRLDRELSLQTEVASESLPEQPAVIRKPPIIQEVITHHRHIDSYEKISPPRRHSIEDIKLRIGADEIDVRERSDRNGDIREEDITIEHRHQHRSPSPRRQSPVEEETTIRSRSNDGHHGGKEIMILEREPARDFVAEDRDRVKEQRKKRYTEVTKDLVVREAIEREGYDYDESENDFYIYEYLRYDDVSKLVDMSEDIRQFRRERMRRERDILPPLPAAPRPPIRETYRERDVLVEGRRPRRRYREV